MSTTTVRRQCGFAQGQWRLLSFSRSRACSLLRENTGGVRYLTSCANFMCFLLETHPTRRLCTHCRTLLSSARPSRKAHQPHPTYGSDVTSEVASSLRSPRSLRLTS